MPNKLDPKTVTRKASTFEQLKSQLVTSFLMIEAYSKMPKKFSLYFLGVVGSQKTF